MYSSMKDGHIILLIFESAEHACTPFDKPLPMYMQIELEWFQNENFQYSCHILLTTTTILKFSNESVLLFVYINVYFDMDETKQIKIAIKEWQRSFPLDWSFSRLHLLRMTNIYFRPNNSSMMNRVVKARTHIFIVRIRRFIRIFKEFFRLKNNIENQKLNK